MTLLPLETAILMLAASVLVVAGLRRFNLPALLGYLLVGVILGPLLHLWAGDFSKQSTVFQSLAHFGVVFLMFSVGLEFNIGKLSSMRRFVFGLGGAQVGWTIIAGLAVLIMPAAVMKGLFLAELDWRAGLVLASALAMSSTALIAKLMSERREIETEHGQRVMGILLFQDLAVIPILVLLPTLAGRGGDWRIGLGLALLKAVVILVLLFKFGRPWLRKWFTTVARAKSHELFTVNVLLVVLLAAWMTERWGLSMELGAFVAGMLIAETEFRHQVEEDIKPFRDVLLGLFFISLGMRLDWGVVFNHGIVVLFLVLLPIAFKFALIFLLARHWPGQPSASIPTAARTALYLAQAGEFGLVILTQALDSKLLPGPTLQVVLAAMLISLLVSSILLANSDRLLLRLTQQEWLTRSVQLQSIARSGMQRRNHVVLCGFGRSGQSVAHVLEAESIPYVALDLDPDRITAANAAGETAVYGDASRRETLLAAGIHRAAVLVITINDSVLSQKILAQVRELAPKLPVLVRTGDHQDIELLRQAGATEVVPEIVEGSLLLASQALAYAGLDAQKIQQRMTGIRTDRYGLVTGYIHGEDEHDETIEGRSLHLQTFRVADEHANKPLSSLPLQSLKIIALLRGSERLVQPATETLMHVGDRLVVAGSLSELEDLSGLLPRETDRS